MGIKRSSIEELRLRANLVEVAERYTQLKRAGREFLGLSPFKPEKTPSFFINPEKNVFKCYSSGEGGDLFRFIQLVEHVDFTEAIEILAERYGVALEYDNARGNREDISIRRRVFAMNEAAALFYKECFRGDDELGRFAQNYWGAVRGFSDESGERFGVGIAPPEIGRLGKKLRGAGFSEKDLEASGLFHSSKGRVGERLIERFRGRLVLPIRDEQGRIAGFSARKLEVTPEDDFTFKAKYVNSPEGVAFQKSQILYGLDLAREEANENRPLILVEGQLDAIRMHDVGIRTAVASQGTAITERHLQLVRRYANRLEVLLDGDSAGQRAATACYRTGLKVGLEIRFAQLEEGADPDLIGLKEGRSGIERLRKNLISGLQLVVQLRAPVLANLSVNEQATLVRDLFEIIRDAESEVIRQGLRREVAQLLVIDPQAIEMDWQRFERRSVRRERHREGVAEVVESTARGPGIERLTTAYHELLLLLLHFDSLAASVAEVTDCSWINGNSIEASLLRRWIADLQEGIDVKGSPLDRLPDGPQERDWLSKALAFQLKLEDPWRRASEVVQFIYRDHLSRERKIIVEEMNRLAEDPVKNGEALAELQLKRVALRKAEKETPYLTPTNSNP